MRSTDPDLSNRLERMLMRMSLLSEGVVMTPGIGSSSAQPSSTPPPVIDSLKDMYEMMLSEVRPFELRKLRMICLMGEEELDIARNGPAKIRALESSKARAERILRMYQGWSPTEIAVAEDCSEGYIRKIRKEADEAK